MCHHCYERDREDHGGHNRCCHCGQDRGPSQEIPYHESPLQQIHQQQEEIRRLNLQLDEMKKERDGFLRHANEGWALANTRTGQWKDAERLNQELQNKIVELKAVAYRVYLKYGSNSDWTEWQDLRDAMGVVDSPTPDKRKDGCPKCGGILGSPDYGCMCKRNHEICRLTMATTNGGEPNRCCLKLYHHGKCSEKACECVCHGRGPFQPDECRCQCAEGRGG